MMSYRNGNGVAGERVYLSQLYARILDDVEQGRDVLWMFPRGADVAEHMGNLYRLAAHYLRVEMIDEPRWRPVAVEGSPDGSPLRVQLALGAHGGDDSEAAADLWLARQPDFARLSVRFDLVAILPRRWPVHVPDLFSGRN